MDNEYTEHKRKQFISTFKYLTEKQYIKTSDSHLIFTEDEPDLSNIRKFKFYELASEQEAGLLKTVCKKLGITCFIMKSIKMTHFKLCKCSGYICTTESLCRRYNHYTRYVAVIN